MVRTSIFIVSFRYVQITRYLLPNDRPRLFLAGQAEDFELLRYRFYACHRNFRPLPQICNEQENESRPSPKVELRGSIINDARPSSVVGRRRLCLKHVGNRTGAITIMPAVASLSFRPMKEAEVVEGPEKIER
jgi:hypothetical protein